VAHHVMIQGNFRSCSGCWLGVVSFD